MTATDELRRMLDERGVEYEGGERSVRWRDRHGIMMQAFPLADGELGMEVWSCTPEQAIAATLGAGTCKRVFYEPTGVYVCSECGRGLSKKLDKYCYLHYCPNCGRRVEVSDG